MQEPPPPLDFRGYRDATPPFSPLQPHLTIRLFLWAEVLGKEGTGLGTLMVNKGKGPLGRGGNRLAGGRKLGGPSLRQTELRFLLQKGGS